ncbi:hypothetical protein PRIPAC_85014 [Pristionchus pacificus]|nr:hypothetical protein PRIPAC_85014 [Pristionchus pacificus]
MHPAILEAGAPIPRPAWMEKPPVTTTDIPPGLEYLVNIEFVRIKKVVEFENMTSLFVPNRYVVENSKGEQIFVTTEQPNSLRSTVRGAARGYKFDMYDKFSRLAFRIERPEQDSCDCCSCCFGVCSSSGVRSIVESPVGTLAGVILSKPSLLSATLAIRDGDGTEKILVRRTDWFSSFATEVQFNVDPIARNEHKAALITGRRRGKSNVFEIQFLPDLDARMKASIIGAAILLDFTDFNGGSNSK